MLPLGEKPVLEHLILWLKKNGIKELVICVGYLRRVIEEYFEDGKELGVKINYVKTSKPMGTAGQLKSAEGSVKSTFLCVYGDSVYDFDLKSVVNFHKEKRALATICVVPYKATSKYGFIDTDSNGKVKGWKEKPEFEGLINIGCYIMEPKFLDYIPAGTMFGMDEAFQNALRANERIFAYKIKGDFIDIGDRKAYTSAYEKYLNRLGRIA